MPVRQELFEKMTCLKRANTPFALATVIHVQGSSSGKLGDKALYDTQGGRITGWVGGGCVERMAGEAAAEALADGQPRTININLDGDDLVLAIPCGGELTIMVDPQLARPTLLVSGHGRAVESLADMAKMLDFRVVVQTFEDQDAHFKGADEVITIHLDLDKLSALPEYIVLATHHPNDNELALQALRMGVPYVAVLASRKRSGLIREYLEKEGLAEKDLERFHSPVGLDLKAKTPEEIALSIISEIVMLRNGGTGQPLGRLSAVSS